MRTIAFVGREAELGVLETAYQQKHSALIPIFGRRRVGKSELIRQFMAGKTGAVYFLGKQAPAGLQIREFVNEAAAALGEPLLAAIAPDNWQTALSAVVQQWKGSTPLILALDEFQWSVAASPELPSVLQGLWDREWSRGGKVLLILCGSYVGFMERELLGKKSPLFGRRTAQIHLKPFGYREVAAFHSGRSLVDRACAYFICGGVPYYHLQFSPSLSIEGNIAALLLDEYGPLHAEPDFLLREELREVDRYYAVLFAIGSGSTVAKDIARRAGIDDRGLYYYLQQLVDLGYLRRAYPLTAGRPAARHVRYELDDALLRFWFHHVFPNKSYIAQMGPRSALRDRIRPNLAAYFGTCFERLCLEALPALYAAERVTAAFTVGQYWDRDVQIDVVGLRDDNWIDLGECKWGAVRSPRRLLAELESKVRGYPNPRNATIRPRVFTRDPVGKPQAGAEWHCLRDLYGLG